MADRAPRMIFLGFGKWARSDRIYALEPLEAGERGHGRRTRVWIEGLPDPIVASRTERTILADMGQDSSTSLVLDEALGSAAGAVRRAGKGGGALATQAGARRLVDER